ncbi:MAG: CoA transferase [Sphingomonadales bacterium]|nr:CoA transferase [Sphingomonadales bacterium]NCO99803.1 CoA transferase [Sphingomonadales bacterium]NCP28145.1 CoA transferase [Sphingomonadales bacterium]NCP42377.1 CoA transferase [Sphingomonadales bacterium]NCP48730.1 CoA transferase [Sphingomonadales bacterium]
MTETTQPLAGIRVVEFSTMITASLATMMFAQQGADVIKVEPPGIGDPMRWLGSQKAGISGLFHNCNQAKRSITLDLKSPDDVASARQLCLQADVVIHNYRPGVMDRLGLGSATLRQEKPELIYCAITGFGHEGPLSNRPAYDHVMQAMSGLMTLQGHPAGFAYVKTLICDKLTAYTAAQAITASLFARERTGKGQHIDLSMLESCIAFLWPDGGMHLTLQGEDVAHGAPFADYYQLPLRSTNGAIAYAAMTDAHWDAVFDIVGRADLKTEEKYKGMANRSIHMAELASIIAGEKPNLTSAEMVAGLAVHDVPAAACLSLEDLPANQQALAMGIFEQTDHPLLGPVQHVTAPARFGGTKLAPVGPSPALGEHSADIWAELAAQQRP